MAILKKRRILLAYMDFISKTVKVKGRQIGFESSIDTMFTELQYLQDKINNINLIIYRVGKVGI